MVQEELYESCLPILTDKDLEEEDQVEKLEELLRSSTSLSGQSLDNAVLDVLWRFRGANRSNNHNASSPPVRHTVIRRQSPAPWQMARSVTPSISMNNGNGNASPTLTPSIPPGFAGPPGFTRTRSSVGSPFTSPRPSPRLAFAQPIPHSPSLNAYEFSEPGISTPDIYGDYGSDTVDWLVNDDARSTTSSIGGLSAAAAEYLPQPDMSPYDILRSVLGDKKTNEEIEEALEGNNYDLGATIAQLSQNDNGGVVEQSISSSQEKGSVLVGKSLAVEQPIPVMPMHTGGRSAVVCKYWLSTGQCLRADCRFGHDLTNHLCKYWLAGNCLAGDGCPFSHDPSSLVSNVSLHDASRSSTPSQQATFHLQDSYDAFPALTPSATATPSPSSSPFPQKRSTSFNFQPGHQFQTFVPAAQRNRQNGSVPIPVGPRSRPQSRHRENTNPQTAPSVDDPEAFPTLASLAAKGAPSKKHHGKRGGHGHNKPDNTPTAPSTPSSLADVVRSSPSPAPSLRKGVKGAPGNRMAGSSRENSAAAMAIPVPKHIPWLETGAKANQQYLQFRAEAIKHGTIRNKFLQSAAQAWNRNDARAAKALSIKGQAENEAMRKAHREAAKALYEARNPHLQPNSITNTSSNAVHRHDDGSSEDTDDEIYIDLHGLHPEESIEYLASILSTHAKLKRKVVYAITGTGHHSKNGKDKVGKAIRGWLGEGGFVFREFSVPGERGGYVGGVLGIEPGSGDCSVAGSSAGAGAGEDGSGEIQGGKVRVLRREDVES